MKHTIPFILSLFLFLLSIQLIPSHAFDSIFSFGDSYTDTGNLNVLAKKFKSSPMPSDNLPYGQTFFRRPSHRFSDGRLIVDFFAEEFGLPYLKPYLGKNGSFRQGANFAVEGATALDPTFFKEHNLTSYEDPLSTSLSSQLQWFKELKPSLCQTTKECRDYFSRSLFIVGHIEGRDYVLVPSSKLPMMVSYAAKIIQIIARIIKELLDQGAQTVVVPGNMPIGCLPAKLDVFDLYAYDKSSYDPKSGCIERYNTLSRHHNYLLLKAVKELRVNYPQAKIIYADFYEPVLNFVRFPQRYGFISKPLVVCCGKGGKYNYSLIETCSSPNVTVCKNPSTYLNWDGLRLTEAAYRYIANSWLKGPYADPPIVDAHKN
ncbi:GDSL esterase/lipase [Rhynchospora pubera]|uniref:GDSL esterase/lipase n=1 Tax=Rhynchospora pubera TaxID=906938 RepID=A0AAV8DB49_9POAL|nr:GDSL esterase/lipase [Rhynchospora pubera]